MAKRNNAELAQRISRRDTVGTGDVRKRWMCLLQKAHKEGKRSANAAGGSRTAEESSSSVKKKRTIPAEPADLNSTESTVDVDN